MLTHHTPGLPQAFSQESLDFQARIAAKSGLGWDHTALPPAMFVDPPAINMANARTEAELVLYPVVEAALKKTGAPWTRHPGCAGSVEGWYAASISESCQSLSTCGIPSQKAGSLHPVIAALTKTCVHTTSSWTAASVQGRWADPPVTIT